jgi:hypothetical protein
MLSVVCLLFASCFNAPVNNGAYKLGTKIAFDYHPLTADDIDYLSRFDIIVTHNLEEKGIVKRLKNRSGKLFFYEWLPALYYTGNPASWERLVYKNKEKWTLDPKDSAPNPMGDKLHCKDYFYDMADDELIEQRVNYLVHQAKSHGYDGVFFDWGSGWYSLQENGYTFLTDEFARRHPKIRYNDRVNMFLGKLREKGLLVILNGGFRSENAELDRNADVDIVESMFTSDQCGTSSWIDEGKEGVQKACETWFNTLEKSLDLAERLPKKAASANQNIRFIFLNYAFPYHRLASNRKTTDILYEKTADRQAIYYSLALSYLGNTSGFTNGTDVSLLHVKDEVYFNSVGSATTALLRPNKSSALRYFSYGFVVAAEKEKRLEIALPPGVKSVLDLYNSSTRINASFGKVSVLMKPEKYLSGAKYPMGRIFLYEY